MTKVGICGRFMALLDVILLHGSYIYGHSSDVNGGISDVTPINGISQSNVITIQTQHNIGNDRSKFYNGVLEMTTHDDQILGDRVHEFDGINDNDYKLSPANNEHRQLVELQYDDLENEQNRTAQTTVDIPGTTDWNANISRHNSHQINRTDSVDTKSYSDKTVVSSKWSSKIPLHSNTIHDLNVEVNYTSDDVSEQLAGATSSSNVDGSHGMDGIKAGVVTNEHDGNTRNSDPTVYKLLVALNATSEHTHGHRVHYEVPFKHHLSLVPMEDEPFGRLVWKNERYVVSVLIPIGIGLVGAVAILVTLYMMRCIARRSSRQHERWLRHHTPVISSIESQASGDRDVLITDTMEEDF